MHKWRLYVYNLTAQWTENPNPNDIFSIAALMFNYNKIRIRFTKHNSGRQKLTNIYTVIER